MVKIQTELEFIMKNMFLFDPVPDLPKLSSLEYTCSELCFSFSVNFFLSSARSVVPKFYYAKEIPDGIF